LVATNPKELTADNVVRSSRVQPGKTDEHIQFALASCHRIMLGWGANLNVKQLAYRKTEIRAMLLPHRSKVYVWKLTSGGAPQHPLYLPSNTEPKPWNGLV